MKTLIFIIGCLVLPLRAADIPLADGRVLKNARIIVIGETEVMIAHSAGVTSAPADLIPLDTLARAHMELSAKAADRKKVNDAVTEKAAKQIAIEKEKRDGEIRVRLAMANARAQAQGGEQVAIPKSARQSAAVDKEIAKLKANLPTHPAPGSQDPAVRDCISKYVRAFSQISRDTIPQNAKWIRDNVAQDVANFQKIVATTDGQIRGRRATKSATGAMHDAAVKNTAWLNALLSHTQKFEALVQ